MKILLDRDIVRMRVVNTISIGFLMKLSDYRRYSTRSECCRLLHVCAIQSYWLLCIFANNAIRPRPIYATCVA